MVPITVAETLVIEDVAGRLLQIGGQSAPLQHFGEEVGGLLTGQMCASELCHRVVSVLREDPLVELLGSLEFHRLVAGGNGVGDRSDSDIRLFVELIEEESAHRLGRSAVPGEQGSLDHLRQVHDGEHGAVELGEEAAQHRSFRLVEGFDVVAGRHGSGGGVFAGHGGELRRCDSP